MIEVIIQPAGDCEEAVLAYLDENNIQAAVKSGFAGEHEDIVFYLDDIRWKDFRPVLLEKLEEISGVFGIQVPAVSENSLEPKKWQDAWKQYARIYRFGHDLIVKPSWRKLRKVPPCPIVCIDPQMAFGTGGHASTRLCLRHLICVTEAFRHSLDRVLDVGTGSGILAIAAARLGARRVVAVDVNPDAIAVARANAMKNGVADVIEFREGTIRNIPGQYGLILANINEAVLSSLLEEFAGHLKPSGILVVSGILREQGDAFLEKGSRAGLRKLLQRMGGEWISFSLALYGPQP